MNQKRNCTALCFSPTGTCAQTVKAVLQGMGGGRFEDLTVKGEALRFAPGDLAVFSAPVFGGRVPAEALKRVAQLEGNGAAAAAVVVYGNRAYEDALLELGDALTQAGFTVIGGGVFLARHSIIPAIASGRPSREDLDTARDFGRALLEKLEAGKLCPVELPGNRPYKKYGGMAVKPIAGDACVACGLCAANCPTGAIPKDDPKVTDPALCITCMRCIHLCPHRARALAPEAQDLFAAKLARVCAEPKRDEIYL